MFVVEVVAGVVVVLLVAFALASIGGGLPDAPTDAVVPMLPTDRLLVSDDIAKIRFRTTVRGYRMDEVDAALDALHAALWAAEQKLAEHASEDEKT